MRCDNRLEVRLPTEDKLRAARHADAANVNLSTFVRRLIDASLNGRAPVTLAERREVESLRRRVNGIHARLTTLAQTPNVPPDVVRAIRAIEDDLSTAHTDAARTLGPC
jgi:transaldolase